LAVEHIRRRLRDQERYDGASLAWPASRLAADGDFPLVWAKTYGERRVVSSLSHSREAWDLRICG
jgi:hypothetical protein